MSEAARRIPYARFREVYDAVILGADFLEEHAYYEHYRAGAGPAEPAC
jgi:hypothetical protein